MESICTPRSKLPDVGTTIFTVIGDLARQYDALNLAQGAPNFSCDPKLVDEAAAAMRAGYNQYAPMAGIAALREALARKIARLYGARYGADDEITIVASASEGLYASISALVHPGDEVVYFEPAFDSHAPIVRLQGATPVPIKLLPRGFRVDWEEVAAALSPRTRMIIINTPHNPTATVFGAGDIARLTALTHGTGIVILSDEVHEHVVFDGAVHHSMARYPEVAERSVIVCSFGKSYHVTGWRVGYCLAPATMMSEIRKIHQFMAGALAGSRFELMPSEGSFFMLARFRGFSDEKDSDFALRLIRDFAVATIPLSAFYSDGTDHGIIRLSFAED
jgi:aspartate/methionine/tyrosine aminotransferase